MQQFGDNPSGAHAQQQSAMSAATPRKPAKVGAWGQSKSQGGGMAQSSPSKSSGWGMKSGSPSSGWGGSQGGGSSYRSSSSQQNGFQASPAQQDMAHGQGGGPAKVGVSDLAKGGGSSYNTAAVQQPAPAPQGNSFFGIPTGQQAQQKYLDAAAYGQATKTVDERPIQPEQPLQSASLVNMDPTTFWSGGAGSPVRPNPQLTGKFMPQEPLTGGPGQAYNINTGQFEDAIPQSTWMNATEGVGGKQFEERQIQPEGQLTGKYASGVNRPQEISRVKGPKLGYLNDEQVL